MIVHWVKKEFLKKEICMDLKKFFSKEECAKRDQKMDAQLRENFTSVAGKAKRKKNVRIFFLITLLLVVCIAFLNWGVITDWGNVRITRLTLVGNDGAKFSGLVYVPKNATDETPAPALINLHGNAGNARNHESWAVEFARRGFVVLSVDQFGSGDSEQYMDSWGLNVSSITYVGDMFYNYLLSMPVVDTENIISAGHSMGCSSAKALGAKYNAKTIISASGTTISFVDDSYKAMWEAYRGNVLNTTGDVEATVEKFEQDNMKNIKQLEGLDGFDAEVGFKADTLYGSFEEGNAYYATREYQRIHEAAFVNSNSIRNILWFGLESIGEDVVPNYIAPEDQVWQWKDFLGLMGIFAFGAFICAIALLLIEEIPAFEIVKQPLPRNIGLRNVGMLISVICGLIFPWIVLKTGTFGILTTANKNAIRAPFFLTYGNVAFFTVIGLNVMGLLTFILFCFTDGKRHKMKLRDLGLTPDGTNKISLMQVWKTILLSAIVLGCAFGFVLLQETLTGTDFYAWFFGFKSIPLSKIQYYWPYLIIWIICFFMAGVGMNIERRLPSFGKEWVDNLVAVVFNVIVASFTLVLVIAVKWHLQSIGSAADKSWLLSFNADTQRLWGMPAGMAVGVGGSTYLFKKTGNTWLSAILMGTVTCLTCVLFGQLRF